MVTTCKHNRLMINFLPYLGSDMVDIFFIHYYLNHRYYYYSKLYPSIHNIMQSTTRTRDKALQFDVYLNNKARNSCIWIAVETNFQCIILAVISCYLSSREKFLRTSDFNGNGTLTSAVPMWIGLFSPTQMVECYIGITEVKVLVPFKPEFLGLPR